MDRNKPGLDQKKAQKAVLGMVTAHKHISHGYKKIIDHTGNKVKFYICFFFSFLF